MNLPRRSALVLVVDGLRADALGPYGNTWSETPAFNRLAAESVMFEFAMTDSPRLETSYRSYWRGLHALAGDLPTEPPLLAALRECGVATRLITDSADLAAHPLASDFDDCLLLPADDPRRAATAIEQTSLVRLMAAVEETLHAGTRGRASRRDAATGGLASRRDAATREETLRAAEAPILWWIHARGMFGPWDAPTQLRHQFADEDDPLPPDFVDPPERRMSRPADPDELLTLAHAYAGQVAVVDACLAALMNMLEHAGEHRPLVLVTAPRGYPLGEHGGVGLADPSLYGELLRVPLFLRFPDRELAGFRAHALVQPADVCATLLEWFQTGRSTPWGRDLRQLVIDEPPPEAAIACAATNDESALLTGRWFLRSAGEKSELFVKPDDRWEANEIANRCEAVVSELESALEEYRQAAFVGDRARLHLPESLWTLTE